MWLYHKPQVIDQLGLGHSHHLLPNMQLFKERNFLDKLREQLPR